MFSFFQPKKYLVDYMGDFTDIHNHILPGIDDGAKNLEESIILIKEFRNIGINSFISTPHIMNDYYGNNKTTIEAAHKKLIEKLTEEGIERTDIGYAAEYMLDTQYEQLLQEKELLLLKDNFLLLEISFFQAPLNLEDVLFHSFTQGYTPIFAHPERYAFFHHKFHKYQQLKDQGVPFQLNILSLSDHYGSSVRKTANKLLENGMIDFLGTDTHHIQHIEKLKQIKLHEKQLNLVIPIIERTKRTFGC